MKQLTTLALGLGLFAIVQGVQAHDRYSYSAPWADWYARTTSAQIQLIHQTPCRHHGDRWQGNYSDHYRWASRHSQYQAEHEVLKREQHLQKCRNSYYQADRYYQPGHSKYAYPPVHQASYQIRYRQSYSINTGRHSTLGIALVFGH